MLILKTRPTRMSFRLGNADIGREKVRWAAREVRADEFIQKIDGAYESEVKERVALGPRLPHNTRILTKVQYSNSPTLPVHRSINPNIQ